MNDDIKIKSRLYNLLYDYRREYNCPFAQITFKNPNNVSLKLRSEEYTDIRPEKAVGILNNKLRKKKRKGKGYLEDKSMSVNAKNAYDKGLKPISKITASDLRKNRFHYSVAFFKWIVKTWNIRPEEKHHTSASKQPTSFYGDKTIQHIADTCNLDLLYKIYLGKILIGEAKRERGIQYVKVKILDSLIGGTSGKQIIMNCILCEGVIFYSQKLCFYENERLLEVVETYDTRPDADFSNKHLKKVSEKLVLHKTSFYKKHIKRVE